MTTQVVSPAQVLAAQLAVELQLEDGEQPDPALVAISRADVAEPPPVVPHADRRNERMFANVVRDRYPNLTRDEAAAFSQQVQSFVTNALEANWDLAVVHQDAEGNEVVDVLEIKQAHQAASKAATELTKEATPESIRFGLG